MEMSFLIYMKISSLYLAILMTSSLIFMSINITHVRTLSHVSLGQGEYKEKE